MIPRFTPTVGSLEIFRFLGDVLTRPNRAGDATRDFEKAFARYLGRDHAVFVPSGRMGLWLLLKALDYPNGSEIVLPAFTYYAMPAVVKLAGLTPVFADIDAGTYEITPDSVRAVLTSRTRAILPTHLFGRTCPLASLQELCGPAGVDIIEDCAQSLGATVGGGKAGCRGVASCFTFGITKNFTTFSGGMLVCRDEKLHREVRRIMADFHPASKRRLLKEGLTSLAMGCATCRPAFNVVFSPLLKCSAADGPDVIHRVFEEKAGGIDTGMLPALQWFPVDSQARAGARQLAPLDAKNEARRARGVELLRRLKEAGIGKGLPLPAEPDGDHIFMSFAITRSRRYVFSSLVRKYGVDVSPGYMSDCSGMMEFGGVPGSCPVSQYVVNEIVHLPLYPSLRENDLARIATAVARADDVMTRG